MTTQQVVVLILLVLAAILDVIFLAVRPANIRLLAYSLGAVIVAVAVATLWTPS